MATTLDRSPELPDQLRVLIWMYVLRIKKEDHDAQVGCTIELSGCDRLHIQSYPKTAREHQRIHHLAYVSNLVRISSTFSRIRWASTTQTIDCRERNARALWLPSYTTLLRSWVVQSMPAHSIAYAGPSAETISFSRLGSLILWRLYVVEK